MLCLHVYYKVINIFQDDAITKRNVYARDMLISEDSDASLDKNFHARYGNNLLPLPPPINIPKVAKLKHCII